MEFYLDRLAWEIPGKTAFVFEPEGRRIDFATIAARSLLIAKWLRDGGVAPAEHIAFMLPNCPEFIELAAGGQRRGIFYTPISTHLKGEEAAYILRDCGAKLFVAHREILESVPAIAAAGESLAHRYVVGGAFPGFQDFDAAVAAASTAPIDTPWEGFEFLYSSGTTGLPKAIKQPLTEADGRPIDQDRKMEDWRARFGFTRETVYLSPAPLYHAAPLRYSFRAHRLGGTVVVMEKFDAEAALALIERERVTHSQWVPSMFVRMLDLPEATRARYDLSSHQVAVHAAAPCPVPLKERMFDWWGPILWEYYAGSESVGLTVVGPQDWLAHRGTVGKPLYGRILIMDEAGENELPQGTPGQIYFATGARFEYHNDAEKTRSVYNSTGAATIGDIGYLDAEGWLYLTDRKSHMIITGGVNVYPQEVENLLSGHPQVADVAVFGVPNREFGEEVKAVVQPRRWEEAGPELGAALVAWCRERLSTIKCPRTVDFVQALPRTPTGKLMKRELKAKYG